MKKLFLLFCGIFLSCNLTWGQMIVDGVLKSWSGATGAITIPDGVTEIAENCFCTPVEGDDEGWGASEVESNTSITSVNLNNVKKIGKEAFKGCTGIETLIAPKVEEIAEDAFDGCTSLKRIELPAIAKLGKKAFAGCSDVTEILLGENLTEMNGNPFQSSSNVKSLTATGKNFYTLHNALIRNSDATLVALAGASKEIALEADVCKRVGEEAFFGCQNLETITLPGVTIIENKAFTNCSRLTKIIVPKLLRVEDRSFITWQGVGALSMVDIHEATNFETFGNSPFADKASTTIYVASQEIKDRLEKIFKKCKVSIGIPGETKSYTVSFTYNEGGIMEAWTTGGLDIKSGNKLPQGALVRLKATPRSGYKIASWVINGKKLTETLPTENTNGQIYTEEHLSGNLNVVVTFEKLPQGYVVFFANRSPKYGTLTCMTEKGKKVSSKDQVPVGSKLIFTATANKNFHVAEWYKDMGGASDIVYEPIKGQSGKTTYECMAEDGLDIQVDFERDAGYLVVNFASLNDYGTVTARADGKEINAGAAVKKGTKVVFTALPKEGYGVDSWIVNNEPVADEQGLELVIPSLEADIDVELVCAERHNIMPEDAIVNGEHLVKWQPSGDVTIPNGIKYIDTRAFEGANKMTSLHISKDVKEIGELAFLYCMALKQITIDAKNPYFTAVDGVIYSKDLKRLIAYPTGKTNEIYQLAATTESIKPGAFASNFNLTGVTVEQGNKFLVAQNGALYNRDLSVLYFHPIAAQKEVVLKEGIKRIERWAFAFSPRTDKIQLPESLEEIAELGLAYNMSLTSAGWADGVTPKLSVIGDSAFYQDRSLAALPYIPTLTKLGAGALYNCLLLEEVHLPQACKVGTMAFKNCQNIKRVFAYGSTPTVIDDDMFGDIVYIDEAVLYVPKGTVALYQAAMGWRHFSNIVDELVADGIGRLTVEGNVRIERTTNGFIVSGLSVGQTYNVFTLTGRFIARGKAEAAQIMIPVEHKQPYLLTIGKRTYKLY